MTEPPLSRPKPPIIRPQAVLTPPKNVAGFFLCLGGIAAFMLGIQFAWRKDLHWVQEFVSFQSWQIGPFISAIGCMFFCTGVVLIWNTTLSRLIVMTLIAGFLLWGVSQVSLATLEEQKVMNNYRSPMYHWVPPAPVTNATNTSNASNNDESGTPASNSTSEPANPQP